MAHHVRGVYELTLAVSKAKAEGVECVMITPKKHVTTLGFLLHACDLSNPTKPLPIYEQWTKRVMEEFFAQSSEEKELSIDVTLPEKETANIAAFQIGFIRFIQPFFETLNQIKDIDMTEQLRNLSSNLNHWLKERKEGKEGKEKATEEEKKGEVEATTEVAAAKGKVAEVAEVAEVVEVVVSTGGGGEEATATKM